MSVLLLGAPLTSGGRRRLAELADVDDLAATFAIGANLDDFRDGTLAMLQQLAEFQGIVLLGRGSARPFGLHLEPYFRWQTSVTVDGWRLGVPAAVFPTPVGSWWRKPENEAAARAFIRDVRGAAERLATVDIFPVVPYADCCSSRAAA